MLFPKTPLHILVYCPVSYVPYLAFMFSKQSIFNNTVQVFPLMTIQVLRQHVFGFF